MKTFVMVVVVVALALVTVMFAATHPVFQYRTAVVSQAVTDGDAVRAFQADRLATTRPDAPRGARDPSLPKQRK